MRVLLAGAFPLLLLASCLQEEFSGSTPGKGDADITFSLALPGKSSADSRALTDTDENDVKTIDVLVFKENGGEYVYTARCSGTGITTDGGDSRKKNFTVTLRQGRYDLVILANARDLVPQSSLTGKDKQDALALLTVSNTGKWIAKSSDSGYKPIPMWGNVGNLTISEGTSLTGSNAVKLTRMIARVDVQVTGTAVNNFQLTSVHVYNYNTRGSIAPKSLTAADWDVTTDASAPRAVQPNVPASSTLTKGPLVYNGAAIDGLNNRCLSEIYLLEAENHTGGGHATPKALLNRTCLVIGGKYDTDTDPTYYRVDFFTGSGTSQAYLDVLRNHQYIFSINKVSAAGYEDPDIAFESAPVNIEANVLEWNDAQMTEITFDGQNFLAVSPRELAFYKDAATADEGNNQLTIHTDVTAGWKIDVSKITYTPAGTQWLTPSATSGGTTKQTIWLGVDENISGGERTAIIPVTAGRLTYNVVVKQGVTAKKTPMFTFIEMANVDGTGTTVPLAGGMIQAKVNTNMGWALKTNKTGLEASMPEPVNTTPTDYTLSVTIPGIDGWGNINTVVWVEYQGTRINQTTFTQTGYSISITDVPSTVNKYGQDVILSLTGYFPAMNFRAIDVATSVVASTVPTCTATGSTTVNGTSAVVVTVNPNGTAASRNVKFQYEKYPGVWFDIATASQAKSGLTLPTGGMIAPPNILGVGATSGKLTLDGSKEFNGGVGETVYAVYFKWGSTVALSAGAGVNGDIFDETDIAWVPQGFMGSVTDWNSVPYADATNYPSSLPGQINTTGLGDPCKLAVKDGTTGGYKMPAQAYQTWFETFNGVTTYLGMKGRWNSAGTQFYPHAGVRSTTGVLTAYGSSGLYPSSVLLNANMFVSLPMDDTGVWTGGWGHATARNTGVTIRCVTQ